MHRVEPLDPGRHDRGAFTCGERSLDDYLRTLAGQHKRDGVASTHVLVDDDAPVTILGYYSLSAAQVLLHELQPADQRRLPRYPVPAARMGRLAIDHRWQGQGYGDSLIGDAVARCLALRTELGILVLIVDALHEVAAAFYEHYGFRRTAVHASCLYLPLGSPPR